MRQLLLPIACATAMVLGGSFASTANADTITEIVSQSGGDFDSNKNDYDILLTAVVTANLADALNDPDAELTVFAPNDRAFIRLAKDLGYDGNDEAGAWEFLVEALTDLGGGDPIPVLTDVLLYHVAPGSISPFGIILRSIFSIEIDTLLDGATITPFFFRLIDNDPDFKDARLRWPLNIMADNGRIHTINRVLLPIDL